MAFDSGGAKYHGRIGNTQRVAVGGAHAKACVGGGRARAAPLSRGSARYGLGHGANARVGGGGASDWEGLRP